MREELENLLSNYPSLLQIGKLLFVAGITVVFLIIVLWLERKIVRKVFAEKKDFRIHFWENLIRAVIIIIGIQWVMMSSPLTQPFGKQVFQSTAIIGAIAGFAAQPVIADVICGVIISTTKPFVVGDRIEFEDGTGGIVKELTLRHVVIQKIDTVQIVIPNSKINGMQFLNMSYKTDTRSIHFKFQVSYSTDVEEAIKVIGTAVKESNYSIPGKPGKNGKKEYAPVLFMSFNDSSLGIETTVYFEPIYPSEVVKSDINIRVKKALEAAGIEIPYNYLNVMLHEEDISSDGKIACDAEKLPVGKSRDENKPLKEEEVRDKVKPLNEGKSYKKGKQVINT